MSMTGHRSVQIVKRYTPERPMINGQCRTHEFLPLPDKTAQRCSSFSSAVNFGTKEFILARAVEKKQTER
jgi:hypothetical protein